MEVARNRDAAVASHWIPGAVIFGCISLGMLPLPLTGFLEL
jgi:hypothetical protein